MDSRRGWSAGTCVRAGAHRKRNQPGHSGNLLDTRVRSCAAARTPAGADASREILDALSVVCRWLRLDGERQDIYGTAGGVHTADADGHAPQSDIGVSLFPGAGTRVFLSWKSRTGGYQP